MKPENCYSVRLPGRYAPCYVTKSGIAGAVNLLHALLYLDVLTALKDVSYVYFASNKSQIVELCQWHGQKYG
jgi:hypothetical protein